MRAKLGTFLLSCFAFFAVIGIMYATLTIFYINKAASTHLTIAIIAALSLPISMRLITEKIQGIQILQICFPVAPSFLRSPTVEIHQPSTNLIWQRLNWFGSARKHPQFSFFTAVVTLTTYALHQRKYGGAIVSSHLLNKEGAEMILIRKMKGAIPHIKWQQLEDVKISSWNRWLLAWASKTKLNDFPKSAQAIKFYL